MVERCVRDAEAAGSNPVASTKNKRAEIPSFCFFDWVIRFKFVQSAPNAVRDAGLKNRPRPVDDEGRFFWRRGQSL